MVRYFINFGTVLTTALVRDKYIVWVHDYAFTENCLDDLYAELTISDIDEVHVVFDTLASNVVFPDDSLQISDFGKVKTYLNREDFNNLLHLFGAAGRKNTRFYDGTGMYTRKEGMYLRYICGLYELLIVNGNTVSDAVVVPLNDSLRTIQRCATVSNSTNVINCNTYIDMDYLEKNLDISKIPNGALVRIMPVAYVLNGDAAEYEFTDAVLQQEARTADESLDNEDVKEVNARIKSDKKRVRKGRTEDDYADMKPVKLKSRNKSRPKWAPICIVFDLIFILLIAAAIPVRMYVDQKNVSVSTQYAALSNKINLLKKKIVLYETYDTSWSLRNEIIGMHNCLPISESDAQVVYESIDDDSFVFIIAYSDKSGLKLAVEEFQALTDTDVHSTLDGYDTLEQFASDELGIENILANYDVLGNGSVLIVKRSIAS